MKVIRFAAVVAAVISAGVSAADNSITFDIIVIDAKLRPIKDLKPVDVEIIDSGESRPVEDVQLQSGGSRLLAIFLDEYHVQSGDSAERARAALTRFVQTQLRDGDTVALMKPLEPLNAIALTQDRNVVLQAISSFEGRKGDYVARSTFEQNFISRDPRTAAVSRAQVVSSALQALSARLGERDAGRKALVLVSEGFTPAMPRAITHAANRHGVAIYSIDPNTEPAESEGFLRVLADHTGGFASINQADLTPALTQLVTDLDSYYVVVYHPTGKADGSFHPVQVRIKRAGAQTRARAGYWAPHPAPPAASDTRAATLPFRPSHASPYIRPWIGMSRGPNGLTSVTVAWEAGETPPRNQRVAAVTVKAMGADGAIVFQNRISPGDRGRATFDVAPGYAALEMSIHGSSGASLDTDYRGLSIPNLQVTKPTFATPQVLRTRTARNFAEASANASAQPVASRTFSRTERLLVRVPVYGRGDTTPAVTATLLNRRGTAMRELPQVPAELPPGVVQFDLPLASLAPDEYRVELIAANTQGPRDEAREMVVFRVTH